MNMRPRLRAIKSLSAHQLVTNLINDISAITWDYIEKNFPEAYQQAQGSGKLIDAIEIIENYVVDAHSGWYAYMISCLPFTAPLHRANDLRQLYECAIRLELKLDTLKTALKGVNQPGLSADDFEKQAGHAKTANTELIETLTYVMKLLTYKAYMDYDNVIHDTYVTCEHTTKDKIPYCACKLDCHEFRDTFKKFYYKDKNGKEVKIKTVGLLGNISGKSRLSSDLCGKILNNREYNANRLIRALNNAVSSKIEKYKTTQANFKKEFNRQTLPLKNAAEGKNAEVKLLQYQISELKEEKKDLTEERDHLLQQVSFFNSKQTKYTLARTKESQQQMQQSSDSGLRHRGK